MATQLPNLTPRPQDRGWGLTGAGRLFSSKIQNSCSYLANLGGLLMPFFFAQKVQSPSCGLNKDSSNSLKDRHFKVKNSRSSSLRQGSGLKSDKLLPKHNESHIIKEVTWHARDDRVMQIHHQDDCDLKGSHMLTTALKADQITQEALKEPWWLITGPSAEYIYFASDISSIYRMNQTLVNMTQNRPNQSGLAGLGITSGASILTGYAAGCRGYVANKKASKINDYWNQVYGKISMIRGVFEAAGGAFFIPVRGLTIAAARTSAKIVAQSAMILGNIGSALFGVTYLLLAVPSVISMAKGFKFNAALNRALNDPEQETEAGKLRSGIELLMNQLELTRDERKKTAHQVTDDREIWDDKQVKPIDIEDERFLSDYDRSYIRGFVQEKFKGSGLDHITLALIEQHVKLGFINAKKTKAAELNRKVGSKAMALIKEELQKPRENQLINRLDLQDTAAVEDAQSFINKIKRNTSFNIWFNAAVVFFSTLGAVAFFAGMAGSGGILGLVIAIMWVVVSCGMFGIDGYCLWQAYKSEDPKFKDKLMMSIMGFFMTSALVLGTVFSAGLMPLIASAVIAILWFGLSGYSCYRWSKKSDDEDKTAKIARKLALEVEGEKRKHRLRMSNPHFS